MPGANEVLGCPLKYFVFVSQNFISCQISREFAPWMPPGAASSFTSFLVIYLHFLKKTGPLDAPRVDSRAVALSAPPLHATAPCDPPTTPAQNMGLRPPGLTPLT